MITHYGLFWSVNDVFWGRQNNKGAMWGAILGKKEGKGRLKKEDREKPKNYGEYVGLYCLYQDDDLVYVGKSGITTDSCLLIRLRQHLTDHLAGTWNYFSWFGQAREELSKECKITVALHQLEAVAIAITNPAYNRQSGKFKGVTQVFQVKHPDSELSIQQKLDKVTGLLEQLTTQLASR